MLGKLIGGFIVLLVGVNLLPVIGDAVNWAQTYQHAATVANETVAWTSGPAGVALANSNLAHQTTIITCVSNATGIGASSRALGYGCAVASGNYTYTQAGYLINATAAGGSYADSSVNVSYSYRNVVSSDNVTGASSVITGLVILFYAIAVMASGIALAIGGLQDAGMM